MFTFALWLETLECRLHERIASGQDIKQNEHLSSSICGTSYT